MKSLKIAALGVAALGFAAAPAFGAFADAVVPSVAPVLSHIDAISITVDPSCTLGSMTDGAYDDPTLATTDKTIHTEGAYDDPKTSTAETLGTWANGAPSAEGVRTDTLTLTMQPGTKSENIGSTTFTVRCNNAAGYDLKVKAATSGLEKTGKTSVTIPGGATSDTASFWNFKVSDATGMTAVSTYTTAGAVPTSETKIAGKAGAGDIDTGESVKVTYGAGISKSQESGTYTGTVTYTLTALN